jgi:hypothetical protein
MHQQVIALRACREMVCNSLLFLLYRYNLSFGILRDKPGEIENGLREKDKESSN